MPDMERFLRQLQLAVAKSDAERQAIKARHKQQDKVRYAIAALACIVAIIALLLLS